MTDPLSPLEIGALARILDELDYYQLLEVPGDAAPADIKQAYYAGARSFHPDVNRRLDGGGLARCERISKRITEAYCVLRDPRRRSAYDAQRASDDDSKRIPLSQARASHVKQESEERQGKTAQGRQFYQKAMQCQKRGDTRGTINHLQMAVTLEPDSQFFRQQLAEAKAAG